MSVYMIRKLPYSAEYTHLYGIIWQLNIVEPNNFNIGSCLVPGLGENKKSPDGKCDTTNLCFMNRHSVLIFVNVFSPSSGTHTPFHLLLLWSEPYCCFNTCIYFALFYKHVKLMRYSVYYTRVDFLSNMQHISEVKHGRQGNSSIFCVF